MGTPLSWWLAHSRWRLRFVLEAIIALPLVLPPTVLGFYLLIALAPNSTIGNFLATLGLQPPVFNFSGLLIGSVIYSLPFVVQPLIGTFIAIGKQPLEAARCLGASPKFAWWSIIFPLARPGFVAAGVLSFAHTLGEFGVVLMIGGNIPAQTKTLSIVVYDYVEILDYTQAHQISAGLLLFSFVLLLAVYSSKHKSSRFF